MSDGFLTRWSRLKRTQGSEASAEAPLDQKVSLQEGAIDSTAIKQMTSHLDSTSEMPAAEALNADQPIGESQQVDEHLTTQEENEEAALLTDEDMPDLATINATSDMSMFFSKGVSAELRRQALRKFFHQPEFNVRDPLDDYALDYSQPKKLVLEVGDKVRGWAQQQMDDAMQQAKDALLKDVQEIDSVESLDEPSQKTDLSAVSTKVDETLQSGKNETA